jgi:hypothetical protein
MAVLPGAAWLDEGGLRADSGDPFPQDEEVRQDVDHVRRLQLPVDADHQAFAGDSSMTFSMRNFLPSWGPALDEVVGPDVVWPLRPEPEA